MKEFFLTSTLTRKKELFKPLLDNKVKLYVCGVTPYDSSHIGHGRCYVAFDLLFRVLKALKYDVTYVRNFTDIDDKLLKKQQEENKPYQEIAELFIKEFHEDMSSLGCLFPTVEPKVTENIPEIISFIEGLIEKKKAYVVGRDVYFDIKAFSKYGKLSGKKLDDLIAGSRVDVAKDKKHPGDFALWKGNDENLFWKSPWGHGRPGWHIECSALAKKFLGDEIDIHGGGMDLTFPHHENEIAQSECLNEKTFARYWVHNAFVNIDKEKMSKSLGNIFSLRDIFAKFDPMVLRYYFLQHHYKTPIDFSLDSLESVQKAYLKLVKAFDGVEAAELKVENPIVKDMLDALCDDLNSSRVLGIVFENLERIQGSEELKSEVKSFLVNTLGLSFEKFEDEVTVTPEIQKLIDEREEARSLKDWKRADEIRDRLQEMGVEVQDKKI